ncbi:MAG: methylenetetrahydrofolate reductase [NAD(P)H] [Pseudomonadota bacterium]
MTGLPSPRPTISFEFFPPKTLAASARLWRSVERLAPLAPQFVSVTYGAGGTTRERTMAAIMAIRDRARLSVAGHLTCVGASRDEVLRTARLYRKLGCRRIVALRGDPANGADDFEAHPEGFAGSVELIEALAEMRHFDIWVAAYPETHPEAADMSADIAHLKRKIDAGACGAITQFFFDNEAFFRFRDACVDAGITAPIVPGILPIENFSKLCKFAERCQAGIPPWFEKAFQNAEAQGNSDLLALAIASEQCHELLENGVEHLHLYTLNNPDLPYQICQALGIETRPLQVAATCG